MKSVFFKHGLFRMIALTTLACGVGLPDVRAEPPPSTAPAENDRSEKSPRAKRDRPDHPSRMDRLDRFDRFDRFDRGPFESVRREPPDDKEWADIISFSNIHFPNRCKAYAELEARRGKESRVVQIVRQRMAVRYRMLDRAKNDNPDFYTQAITQAKLEDDVWGQVRELKNNPDDTNLQTSVREKVAELVQSLLSQRQERLQNMQKTLEREQQRLADDKANIDKLVQRQLDKMLTGDIDAPDTRHPDPDNRPPPPSPRPE
jgi:hypothetical protein